MRLVLSSCGMIGGCGLATGTSKLHNSSNDVIAGRVRGVDSLQQVEGPVDMRLVSLMV